MNSENYFPLWNDLNTAQKKVISDNLITRDVKKERSFTTETWTVLDYH